MAGVEHDHLAQQRRLAAATGARQREDLAAPHLEADVTVHDLRAEARAHVLDLDHVLGRHGQIPRKLNATENAASATISRKIDCTTLTVVFCPTLSASPLTWKPW